MIKIDFSNPILIAALITGALAFIGAVTAALINRKRSNSEQSGKGNSQTQKTTLAHGTTQIQSGRDTKITTATDSSGKDKKTSKTKQS